jgi:hypothetical protein
VLALEESGCHIADDFYGQYVKAVGDRYEKDLPNFVVVLARLLESPSFHLERSQA